VETEGADTSARDNDGHTIWDGLKVAFTSSEFSSEGMHSLSDPRAVSALMRVLVLQEGPPVEWILRPYHKLVVEQGERLREALPAWQAQRRSLLGGHIPIEPLLDIVLTYDGTPSTTQEHWATGLGLLIALSAPSTMNPCPSQKRMSTGESVIGRVS
jgi:hypothetical protein